MILLTCYKPVPTSALTQATRIPSIEKFGDDMLTAARARAQQLVRDGAHEVFLSRVTESYKLNVQVDVESHA